MLIPLFWARFRRYKAAQKPTNATGCQYRGGNEIAAYSKAQGIAAEIP
jgi:hypothetical protein